jgi:hypothetical protein
MMADVASIFLFGVSMRNFLALMLALPLAAAAAPMAVAETPVSVACKALAAAVADDYMSDEMLRVDDADDAPANYMVAHVYGRKYLIPVDSGTLKPRAIGTRSIEWGKIYSEERRRCLRTRLLNDFTLGN